MLKQYLNQFMKWLQDVLPSIVNQKNFPWIVGGLFLLGIVSKWLVVLNYRRLIKKAENMTHPKNSTLRKIKMKYDGVKEVSGAVANPMLLVQRHLNRCRVGIVSLNKLNHVIDWCMILELVVAGTFGWQLYKLGKQDMVIMAYIGIGIFAVFFLEVVERCAEVGKKQTELSYVIVDYLENGPSNRKERTVEMAECEELKNEEKSIVHEENESEKNENKEIVLRENQHQNEEQIINQVIAEFLQ